ncbi:hypothetical protein FQA47_010224 [Oryzias melastigma]|uniref:Uncharacterized protein n=1 Tax=Oryzias melastigma TaxID=30732 RepID=A0A834F482_ORYME|nr:hypothetical protein FQA47_010224 [Oryzias melastigma]
MRAGGAARRLDRPLNPIRTSSSSWRPLRSLSARSLCSETRLRSAAEHIPLFLSVRYPKKRDKKAHRQLDAVKRNSEGVCRACSGSVPA